MIFRERKRERERSRKICRRQNFLVSRESFRSKEFLDGSVEVSNYRTFGGLCLKNNLPDKDEKEEEKVERGGRSEGTRAKGHATALW